MMSSVSDCGCRLCLTRHGVLLQPFVAEYCKFPMFYTGEGRQRMPDLSEFDDAREELVALSASYRSLEGKAEGTR
jgi:hypothetical protein